MGAELIYERYALFNVAGVVVGRLLGIPVHEELNEVVDVDRIRQGHTLKLRGLARWAERLVVRRASRLLPVSDFLADRLRALARPGAEIIVVPNAVNADACEGVAGDRERVRSRLGWENGLIIGFVGSFSSWHRVDLLARAFVRASERAPNLRLLLIGDGADRQRMATALEAAGLAERAYFAGRVPHAEVRSWVAAMDMAVMPHSNIYGSPVKVFEYLAGGVPTIAPRLGPLEEVIKSGENGLLFQPLSEEALAEAMLTLAGSPAMRKRLGDAGRAAVLCRHLWSHNVARVLQPVPTPSASDAAAGRGHAERDRISAAT